MKPAVLIATLVISMAVGYGQRASDPLERYRQDLEANPHNSLAHFRIAEILSQQGNYQSATNEFREALSGDLQPRWIEVWSHINLGNNIVDTPAKFL
jgi:Tfp pilus assembly protein PilF